MRPWAKYPSLATLALTCLAAAPNLLPASQIYRSPNHLFQFTLPAGYQLQTGPNKHSNSYIPVCHDESAVCATYPRNRFRGTNFGDASFEVMLVDAPTPEACASPGRQPISSVPNPSAVPDLVIDTRAPARLIDGVAFAHGLDGSVALGHGIATDQYRGFLHGHCYALFLNLTSTDFAMYDPGAIRQFTAQDEKQVKQSLTKILDSFRTLPAPQATHERLLPH